MNSPSVAPEKRDLHERALILDALDLPAHGVVRQVAAVRQAVHQVAPHGKMHGAADCGRSASARDAKTLTLRAFKENALAVGGADRARQHVLPAHEAGDIGAARVRVDVMRGAGLLDDALVHHDDEVGERDRLRLRVGDVDEGDAEPRLQPLQLAAHLKPQELVERRKRLVEKEHPRVGDQARAPAPRAAAGRRRAAPGCGRRRRACGRGRACGRPRRSAQPWPMPRIFRLKAMLSRTERCGKSA